MSSAEKWIGKDVGEYKIIEHISDGGMASVFRAEHKVLGNFSAIKILNPVLSTEPEIRERFLQEARIQISLQHNNIVRVLNAYSTDEYMALVLELVEGQSLDKVIKTRGKLPVEDALQIMAQILSAVGYAYDKGVIHRDLKPSNILVCADGTAKVTDFGIAKVLGDTKLTRTGTSMGSPDYMSPEQVLGKKDIDHRTDIYSLGATLYEMLTGRPPFVIENGGTSDSDFLVKTAHVNESPIPPLSLNSEVPSALSNAVLKSLGKKPEDRFESCFEFSGVILNVGSSPSVLKPVASRKLDRSLGFFASNKAIIVFALVSALALVISFRIAFDETLNGNRRVNLEEIRTPEASASPTPQVNSEKPGRIELNLPNKKVEGKKPGRIELNIKSKNIEEKNHQKKGESTVNANKVESACSKPFLCFLEGNKFYYGFGTKVNFKKARVFYKIACDGREKMGCLSLADMYFDGKGGAKDLFRAKELYKKACDIGDMNGCVYLATMYYDGKGGAKDLFRAKELYKKACDIGNMYGCVYLATMYYDGEGGAKALYKAKELSKKACDGDWGGGCYSLGNWYYYGVSGEKDMHKARDLYDKACNDNYAPGCDRLGLMYELGDGGPMDKFKARKLYESACQAEFGRACYNLGRMHLYAYGGSRNLPKAREYFMKACNLENERGCAKVEE